MSSVTGASAFQRMSRMGPVQATIRDTVWVHVEHITGDDSISPWNISLPRSTSALSDACSPPEFRVTCLIFVVEYRNIEVMWLKFLLLFKFFGRT